MQTDILIVGAGIAGLFTALKMAPRPVMVITARPLGEGGSSRWAQGGFAAAVGPDDSAELHLADTVKAGAGLVDREAARILVEGGATAVQDLRAAGVQFDLDESGELHLGREAAHSHNRIVHANGDQAGAAITTALVAALRKAGHARVVERAVVEDLLRDGNGRVTGALVFDVGTGRRTLVAAGETVLATGGLGGLFAVTTNPVAARGHGLAFAHRAGAVVRDPEFVQFHPTALATGLDPAPLATEALRGAGAVLVNADKRPFMADYHADRDLAPRDIVARAVEAEIRSGRGAFLDASAAIGDSFPATFPTVYAACRRTRIDPRTELMPVAPAAHYHMGGVMTELDGRSSLEGLWAVGEVASTGVHGANRLASNSLLEAVVFAGRVARQLRERTVSVPTDLAVPDDRLATPPAPASADAIQRLRQAMSSGCALIRSSGSLADTARVLEEIEHGEEMTSGLKSSLCSARLILTAASARCESRGAHFRSDFPHTSEPAAHTQLSAPPVGAVEELP